MIKGIAQAVDVALGASIRVHREYASMSRQALAEACGISYSQLGKYESGKDRITVARLVEIATILNVSVHDLLASAVGPAPVDKDFLTVLAEAPAVVHLLRDYAGLSEIDQNLLLLLACRLHRSD